MLRTTQISLKSPEEQQKLRVAGALAADVLDMIGDHIAAGVSTDELDQICHDYIVNVQKTIPANVGYRGFPKTVCTSVNHVVCHGIPNERRLKSGDIVNIDVAIIKDGYHGDTSRMYFVGKPPVLGQRLAEVCKDAMWRAIDLVRPAGWISKVGWGPQPLGFNIDPLVQKNITLQGSFSHNWPIWERVIALLSSGQFDVRPIIGGVWPVTA